LTTAMLPPRAGDDQRLERWLCAATLDEAEVIEAASSQWGCWPRAQQGADEMLVPQPVTSR